MFIFVAIAVAAFIIVTGSFVFGHDHDAGHDHDHAGAGHGADFGSAEPTISIFSTKVLGTLLMGFGAAGAIATSYGASHLVASGIGLFCGLLLGGLMYLVLGIFYKQQASSLIATDATVGCCGTVTVSIRNDAQDFVGASTTRPSTDVAAVCLPPTPTDPVGPVYIPNPLAPLATPASPGTFTLSNGDLTLLSDRVPVLRAATP